MRTARRTTGGSVGAQRRYGREPIIGGVGWGRGRVGEGTTSHLLKPHPTEASLNPPFGSQLPPSGARLALACPAPMTPVVAAAVSLRDARTRRGPHCGLGERQRAEESGTLPFEVSCLVHCTTLSTVCALGAPLLRALQRGRTVSVCRAAVFFGSTPPPTRAALPGRPRNT